MRTYETSSVKPKVKPDFGLHQRVSHVLTSHFGLHRAGFTRPHVSTRVGLRGTCSKDIRISTCGMETFTRFYGNLVYCGLISDFSISL